MRGLSPETTGLPRGREIIRALKCKAIVIEGSFNDLKEFLWIWRDRVQWIIDLIWNLKKIPTLNQLHQWFYNILRSHGFRAHHCKQIYKYALSIVKASKNNNGSKPILRKLSARLDIYDYKLDLINSYVELKLHNNKIVKLKLLHRRKYLQKFIDWKNYELVVKIENNEIYVVIYFRKKVEFYTPVNVKVLDLNLWYFTELNVDEVLDKASIRIRESPFIKYLKFKWRAHILQKEYPKSWRFSKNILSKIRYWFKRAKNVLNDYCWKFAKEIVLDAKKNLQLIIFEKLENVTKGKSGWKIHGFCYRKFIHALKCKCEEFGVPYIEVDPKNTSRVCPICGKELTFINYRIAKCGNCGYIGHRDVIAVINLYKKVFNKLPPIPYIFLFQDRVLGSHGMNLPEGNANPRPMWEGKHEGMTIYKTI